MSRIRSIKPELAKSRDTAKCSLPARYFFGILFCEVDDKGRHLYTPKRLSGELFPHDDGSDGHFLVDAKDIIGWVRECCDASLLVHYRVQATEYLWIPKFLLHQKIDRPSPSFLPSPYDTKAEIVRGTMPTESYLRALQFAENGAQLAEIIAALRRTKGADSTNAPPQIDEAALAIRRTHPPNSSKKRKNSEPPAGDHDPGPGPGSGSGEIPGGIPDTRGSLVQEQVAGGSSAGSDSLSSGRTPDELARIQAELRKSKLGASIEPADDPVLGRAG